jgi:tetratricopeptide (TPR) repeat protein
MTKAIQHSLVSVFTPSLMSAEDLEHIFVQREPLAQELIGRIVQSTKGSGKEHSLLIGMRGMGKTHLVSLVYHRVRAMPELQDRLLIAWLREEEWGVDSWLDLVIRILRAVAGDRSDTPSSRTDSDQAQDLLKRLRQGGLEQARGAATQFLRDLIGKRTLLLIIENLDDLFQGLGEKGQQEFRSFLQEYRCCTVLATTQAIFSGVSSRSMPFFGFFHPSYLEPINVDEAIGMLVKIASLSSVQVEQPSLAAYLQSAAGRARVRAVQHLAGGHPRVYILFAQFMTQESVHELVRAFMKMLDDLTPFYQSRMAELSNQQRKIMEFLVDRRQAVMVKEIAEDCFIEQRVVASQLRELKKKGYVVSSQDGRESFYELAEVLMRFGLEVKKYRGRCVELVVDFLKVWYRPEQRQEMLERFGNSRLMAREDLERAFLSSDDPLGEFSMREFEKSLKKQDHEKIIKIFEEVHELKLITDDLHGQLTMLLEQKKYNRALQLLRKSKATQDSQLTLFKELLLEGLQLLRKSKSTQDSQPTSFEELFIEGLLWQSQEKHEEAIASYDHTISIKPDHHEAWKCRGDILSDLGRYEEAITSYDRAISIKPDKDEAWNNRGIALCRLGKYEEAITSYDRAISIKPDEDKAWNDRGIALCRLGKYEEAITSYDRAISIKLDSHEAWNNRGIALCRLGKYEEAITSYDRAISIKLDSHEAWNNRGISLSDLGRYEEAIASYDHSISIKPDDHETWNNRGIALSDLGRYEEAIASYDRAISIKPDDDETWNNRGIALSDLGRYEEAIASYDHVLSIKPNEDKAWHNKGFAYFKWGRYSESIDCSDQAITIKPDKYNSWHDKGLVYFVTSDYAAALASWQQAFNYISDPQVPRYHPDISELIQEFIEELIPRFTQPPIQQTLLVPLLATYHQANVITELGAALVNTLHLIIAPAISDHTAAQWLELWRTSSLGHEPHLELPLRLMATAIAYKKDPSKRQRLWLSLPSEERPILDQALKIQS